MNWFICLIWLIWLGLFAADLLELAMKLRYLNAVYILIGLNVALFVLPSLASMLLGNSLHLNGDDLYFQFLNLLGAMQGISVRQGEVWRLLTTNFLHVDILHIGANMFGLYQLGRIVRAHYGDQKLVVFYIIAGLGGSLVSLLFLNPFTITVGASGAVFGLMGVLLAGSVRSRRFGTELPFAFADILPLLLYSLLAGLAPGANINNFAHFGGLITGFVLAWFIPHNLVGWKDKQTDLLVKLLFYVSVIITVVAYSFVAIQIVQFFVQS